MSNTPKTFAALCCLSCFADLAQAQRELTDIPVPDPDLEKATFVLPDGFEVNLFAADPQIAKPIQMNFDPQGRLWIVSSETYPQIKPGEVQNDKVLVLQDVDGDGTSDSTTVFADGLLIPTGIEPGDGGAYVGNSTQLIHFKDDDGDLKADGQEIMLSGFGTEDTHHIVHTFRWGPDSRLYFGQSIYIHSHIETPWGVERLNAGGFWRFNPDNYRLGVFMRGLVNPWGLSFNDAGQAFATDGAGGEGINHIVPGAYYKTAANAARLLDGLNPGSPKHCGLEIIDGPNLPEEYQGSAIAHDFRGHRVCRFVLSPDGSSFRSRETVELIKSDHVAFRPVDVKQGPDGAIYIADWYNPIIQHGEVDFRDERRDKTHGRIWRVTYKGQTTPRTDFTAASTDTLIEKLQTGTRYERRMARRVLHERERVVSPAHIENGSADTWLALRTAIRNLDQTVPNYWRTRLETLWVQQGLGTVDAESLDFALRCPEADVRAGATRILADLVRGHVELDRPDLLDVDAMLALQCLDADALVRMEAVRALAESPRPTAVVDAMTTLDGSVDKNLDYALWLTARETSPNWLPALQAGELEFAKPAHAVFALSSVGGQETVAPLLALLKNGDAPDESLDAALAAVARFATPAQLAEVLQIAVDQSKNERIVTAVLAALSDAASRRKARPASGLGYLKTLLSSDASTVRAAAAGAIGDLSVKALAPALLGTINDGSADESVRSAAVRSLVRVGDGAVHNQLMSWAAQASDSDRMKVYAALLAARKQQVSQTVIKQLASLDDVAASRPFFEALAGQPKAVPVFVQQLQGQTIPTEAARLALSIVRSSGKPSDALTKAIANAGGIKSGPRKLSPEQMLAMATKVAESGDPHRGEAVYRRARLTCVKCHAIGGAGGLIGPELRSLGATAPIDYVIESLLDPNAKVKEGYNTTLVVTADGKVISGIKVRETEDDLILRDVEGRELSIPLDDIDFEEPGQSLMPAGLVDELPEQDLLDLVAFLKALGTSPEFTVEPRNVVRTWQVMEATKDAAYALRRKSYAAAATDDPAFAWTPRYVTVDGSLPLGDLPSVTVKNRSASGNRGVGFSRVTLEVPEAGPVSLSFGEDTAGLSVWVDGKPLAVEENAPLELTAGDHQVTLSIDTQQRSKPLLLEADLGVWK